MFLRIRLDIIYSSGGRDTGRLRLGGDTVAARLPDWLMRAVRSGKVPISTWDSIIIPSFFSLLVSCLQIPPWDSTPPSGDSDRRLIPPESQAELEVTTAISNLSNTVIAATASRSLAKSVPDHCLTEVLY
jgi:hypothetical protein